MKPEKRVRAAIAIAVLSYIQAEEERMAAALRPEEPAPRVQVSFWAASARQETMHMRRMLQRRMLR